MPIIEGSEGGVKSFSEAKSICKEIGYPVLIKAAGGGGGKGMKVVEEEDQLENLFLTAKSEAQKNRLAMTSGNCARIPTLQ